MIADVLEDPADIKALLSSGLMVALAVLSGRRRVARSGGYS